MSDPDFRDQIAATPLPAFFKDQIPSTREYGEVQQPVFCQQCGQPNPDASQFCDSCGAPLHHATVQQSPGEYQPPPPVYQPPPPVASGMPRSVIRRPFTSGMLSLLCCGLGQLYNGQTLKGVALFFGAVMASQVYNLLGIIIILFAIFDASTTATKINEGNVPFHGKSILFWPVVILLIILIIVVILFAGILAAGLESFSFY